MKGLFLLTIGRLDSNGAIVHHRFETKPAIFIGIFMMTSVIPTGPWSYRPKDYRKWMVACMGVTILPFLGTEFTSYR